MVNKVARTRYFSYIRAMRNMEVQDIPDNIHDVFKASMVYLIALGDTGVVSENVRKRLLFVATDVYQRQMQVFMDSYRKNEGVDNEA